MNIHSTTTGIQRPTSATTAERWYAQKRQLVAVSLWVLGFLLFAISCVIVYFHPQPYPIDVATTQTIQGLPVMPWVNAVLVFPSMLNNPFPAGIALATWLVIMGLMGVIFRARGRSPLTWFQSALFLVTAVLASAGFNYVVDLLVARPRPDPHTQPIHVYTGIVQVPTYPSGHVEHDVVFYGILLYLSFTKPVRRWRYRWILLPIQLYAVFDILTIGYSRVLEGDHWLTDVLSGYLEGALYLCLFIVLYRWTTNKVGEWHAKRVTAKSTPAYGA